MIHPEITVSRAAHSGSEEIVSAFVEKLAFDTLWLEKEQWRMACERVEFAFELSMDITECQDALSAYVGIVYDVAMIALAEQSTALKQELAAAQLDNAGLLDILRQLDYTSSPERAERILAYVRDQEHPGRALMARGLAELSAAEAELALARKVIRVTRSFPNNLMMDALDEYDAFMKGRAK